MDKEEEVKESQCAHPPSLDNDDVIVTNQCLCLPKAELKNQKRTETTSSGSFLVSNSVH